MTNHNTALTIESLDDLVTALSEAERSTFSALLQNMTLTREDCELHESWSEGCYTRNCIAENERFELILICWEGQQMTPIHDHGGEQCWVYIVDGDFEEIIYKLDDNENLNVDKINIASSGDLTFMADSMGVHSLKNCSEDRALTLHLYAKPIRSCNIFDEETSEFESKEMSYETSALTSDSFGSNYN